MISERKSIYPSCILVVTMNWDDEFLFGLPTDRRTMYWKQTTANMHVACDVQTDTNDTAIETEKLILLYNMYTIYINIYIHYVPNVSVACPNSTI